MPATLAPVPQAPSAVSDRAARPFPPLTPASERRACLRALMDSAHQAADARHFEAAYHLLAKAAGQLVEDEAPRCRHVGIGSVRCIRDAGHREDCTSDGRFFFWTPNASNASEATS